MSKSFDKRLLSSNAHVMSQGVGLAALEAMFNMVNTQSMLSASMLRQNDMAGTMSFGALALAMNDILDPCGCPACRGRCRSVNVDIPKGRSSDGGGNDRFGRGAGPGVPEDLAGERPGGDGSGGSGSSEKTSFTSSETVTRTQADLEKLVEGLMEVMDHLIDHADTAVTGLSESTKGGLMVT